MEKIIEIAKMAGEIIVNAHCSENDIDVKPGDANFVTYYDIAVQKFLKKELLALYPTARFIGEESGEDEFSGGELIIVVDPIDGTTNFIRNTNHSCVSIGIIKDKKPYMAIVYDPFKNELFTAKKDCGAYLNGKQIRVSKNGLKNSLVGFGTCPYYTDLRKKTLSLVSELLNDCGDVRRQGSAALDLCYVAAGRFDIFFEYKLSLWDFCAGGLIVTEAGGIIRGADKKELEYNGASAIFAANPTAYDEFYQKYEF